MHTELPLRRIRHEVNEFFKSPPSERLIAPAGTPPYRRAEKETLLAFRAMYFWRAVEMLRAHFGMNEAIGEDFSMLSGTLFLSLPVAKRLTKSGRPNTGLPHQSSGEDAVRDFSKSAFFSRALFRSSCEQAK